MIEFFLDIELQYTFLNYEVFGNTLADYIIASVVFLVVFSLLKFFKLRILSNLHELAKKTKNDFDDLIIEVIQAVGYPFYLFVSLGIAIQFIEQPPWLSSVVSTFALIVVVYVAVKAVQQIIEYIFEKGIKRRLEEDPRFDPSVIRLLLSFAKGTVWAVAILLLLQNLGYNITALIAGLGIGGLAIAFALQSVLGDIFASFSIYLDRPFETGHFIIVDDISGTVKHIGIKSTRIEATTGEEIIVANKDLTDSRVKNYGRVEVRRNKFMFGVTYQTSLEQLKKIPDIVKEIIDNIELTELNRVHFKEFGDFSLNFEVMYSVDSPDYTLFLDIQQEFNLALKERFEKEGIEFAYPTQTIFVEKND